MKNISNSVFIFILFLTGLILALMANDEGISIQRESILGLFSILCFGIAVYLKNKAL